MYDIRPGQFSQCYNNLLQYIITNDFFYRALKIDFQGKLHLNYLNYSGICFILDLSEIMNIIWTPTLQ